MKTPLKITLLLTIILLICGLAFSGKISGDKFDSEKWKNADLSLEENWSLRWDMVSSLRNNYNLVGMSKSDIINLLGIPTNEQGNSIRYSLGYTHTGINAGGLTLELNTNGIVTKVYIHQS